MADSSLTLLVESQGLGFQPATGPGLHGLALFFVQPYTSKDVSTFTCLTHSMHLAGPSRLLPLLAVALLSACSPSNQEQQLEELKAWNPQVSSEPSAKAPSPAPTTPFPVQTFEQAKKDSPVSAAAAPAAAPAPIQVPTAVARKTFRPTELPRADTCEALPLLQALGKDVQWFEVADYSAGLVESLQFLADSTHTMRIAKIRVSEPGKVALLLGAYEPNVWQIEAAPGTTIVGVLASGYHTQRVTGVPGTTPVVITSHEGKGECGYAYKSLAQTFGRQFSWSVVGQVAITQGIAHIGPRDAKFAPDPKSPIPADFRSREALMPHTAGLGQLMSQGALRHATAEERAKVPAWVTERSGDVYTVQRELTLPRGLYGANGGGSLFLVPPGVKEPAGDPGHARVYNMKTKTCRTAQGEC